MRAFKPVPQQRAMMPVVGDGIDSSRAVHVEPAVERAGRAPCLFNYGAKTIRFGSSLDAAEAVQIASKITTTATWLVAT